MVIWLRWHCPPDTGFEIQALAVWGRARYLSVTEAPHNTDFHRWMGKKHFCFFKAAETGNRTPNSGVKGSGANHYPRAPARVYLRTCITYKSPETKDIHPILGQCWASVVDGGLTLIHHWMNVFPANTRHWTNVGSMLVHRLRRYSNITPKLVQCLLFAGLCFAGQSYGACPL